MKKTLVIVCISLSVMVVIYLSTWFILFQYNNKDYTNYGLVTKNGTDFNYAKFKVNECKIWYWGRTPQNNYDNYAIKADIIFGRFNFLYSKFNNEPTIKSSWANEIEAACIHDGEYWLYQKWGQLTIGKITILGADTSIASINIMRQK